MYDTYTANSAKRGDICLMPYIGAAILCEYVGVNDRFIMTESLQTGNLWTVRKGALLKIVSRL